MHFVVIGAGNMGCVYGANLARAGRQVSLVDVWVEHVQAIETRGLRLEGLHGSFTARVQATVDPARVRNADVALICVNAYHTGVAAATAVETLSPDGFVVPLQNGLGNVETLVQELGETRVLPGLTFHSGDLVQPGQVTHTNQGPTYLGELDGSQSERLLALRDVLAAADMNPVLESDIMATIWQKVVLNCAINAICAITDLRPGHISEVRSWTSFRPGSWKRCWPWRGLGESPCPSRSPWARSRNTAPASSIVSPCSSTCSAAGRRRSTPSTATWPASHRSWVCRLRATSP